jgi:integrase
LIALAKEGKLEASAKGFARMSFNDAADRYLEGRNLELSAISKKKETQLLVKPRKFFGQQAVGKMTGEQVLAFREWRVKGQVGPATINMEIGVIRRILKRAKRWHLVASDLKPLREPRTIGRAMSLDEKLRLLRLAAKNPDWQNARLAAVLALNTTMRGCEIKQLRWRDIDLMGRTLTICKSKTAAGERVIPLNATAYATMLELRERAKKAKAVDPHHFVFPSCENGHIDPALPQKSWRSSWRKLTKTIECPQCGKVQDPGKVCSNNECKAEIDKVKSPTAGLRFHDLRHQAITELSESQASDQTIMSIAGHVSPRMLAHYSHVRLQAKRSALDALSARVVPTAAPKQHSADDFKGEQGGYDTNNDTTRRQDEAVPLELLEKNGRPEWTRTIDLFRVKEAL